MTDRPPDRSTGPASSPFTRQVTWQGQQRGTQFPVFTQVQLNNVTVLNPAAGD